MPLPSPPSIPMPPSPPRQGSPPHFSRQRVYQHHHHLHRKRRSLLRLSPWRCCRQQKHRLLRALRLPHLPLPGKGDAVVGHRNVGKEGQEQRIRMWVIGESWVWSTVSHREGRHIRGFQHCDEPRGPLYRTQRRKAYTGFQHCDEPRGPLYRTMQLEEEVYHEDHTQTPLQKSTSRTSWGNSHPKTVDQVVRVDVSRQLCTQRHDNRLLVLEQNAMKRTSQRDRAKQKISSIIPLHASRFDRKTTSTIFKSACNAMRVLTRNLASRATQASDMRWPTASQRCENVLGCVCFLSLLRDAKSKRIPTVDKTTTAESALPTSVPYLRGAGPKEVGRVVGHRESV